MLARMLLTEARRIAAQAVELRAEPAVELRAEARPGRRAAAPAVELLAEAHQLLELLELLAEVAAWAMVLLPELGALARCWSDGLEGAARAVELLAELEVLACRERGGPQVVSRAVDCWLSPRRPLREGAGSSFPSSPCRPAARATAWRSPHGPRSRRPSSSGRLL